MVFTEMVFLSPFSYFYYRAVSNIVMSKAPSFNIRFVALLFAYCDSSNSMDLSLLLSASITEFKEILLCLHNL